jgi:hypothetical protein
VEQAVTSVVGVNVVFGRCSSLQAPTHTADGTFSVTLTVQDPARFPLGAHTTLDSIHPPDGLAGQMMAPRLQSRQ